MWINHVEDTPEFQKKAPEIEDFPLNILKSKLLPHLIFRDFQII